ncbi:hypothetical protein OPV22_032213 [Ensete ventricosum]|uniref:Uncharacterized protein n=1 Tax=Ensete ventricosum TaxID=4639 RepID=A0AAV8PME0_ENSVE|nr:hypothetical protein OPV22_032213 [Ensete ventricosum]
MDVGGADADICDGIKPSLVPDAKDEGLSDEEGEDRETDSLLTSSSVNGGLAGKQLKSSRRNVQWNDRNGHKLVEVLEFEPSDSSDSEDDSSNNSSTTEKLITCCFRLWYCLVPDGLTHK